MLQQLRPFIVTSWTGRNAKEMPDDVREVFEAAQFRQSHVNVALLVLDAKGQFLRGTAPQVRPSQLPDPESRGRDFQRQLDQFLAGLKLPDVPPSKTLAMPDVVGTERPAGVRISLKFSQNKLHHFRTPVVEAVQLNEDVRKGLAYPSAARDVPVAAVRSWLEKFCPPAVMDGLGGFRQITGELKLRPAGADREFRYAVLEGKVWFVLDNQMKTSYQATLAVVVGYGPDNAAPVMVRGVCETIFPRQDPSGRVVEAVTMSAAIESRPR